VGGGGKFSPTPVGKRGKKNFPPFVGGKVFLVVCGRRPAKMVFLSEGAGPKKPLPLFNKSQIRFIWQADLCFFLFFVKTGDQGGSGGVGGH